MRTPECPGLRWALALLVCATLVHALGCGAAPPAAGTLPPADAPSATVIDEAPAALDPAREFRLAIVDGNWELIPIAEYREGRWSHSLGDHGAGGLSEEQWSQKQKEVFGSMAGFTWYSPGPDGRTRVFKAPHLVPMRYHCSTGWTLATEDRQTAGDAFWPKRIALSVHPSGAGFNGQSADIAASAEIGRLVRATFDEDENRRIAQAVEEAEQERERSLQEALKRGAVVAKADPEGPGAGKNVDIPRTRATITAAERSALPLAVSEIVSAMVPGTDLVLHHVDANRSYKAIAVTDCPEISYFQGWLLQDGTGVRWLEHFVGVTDCDGVDSGTTDPLGVVRIGGATFVVAGEHGYEDSRFVIYEIVGQTLLERLTFGAGGC